MNEQEEFAHQVRDAIAHLYDTAHLQEHPLCKVLLTNLPAGAVSNAQALRRVLLEAIEELRPSPQISYSAREWRPYRVLLYRYVQRMPPARVSEELAISERQFQREHSKALKGLSGILWNQARSAEASRRAPSASIVQPPSAETDNAAEEARRLVAGARCDVLDAEALLRGTLLAVEKLASSRQVTFKANIAPNLSPLYGDPGLFRQILLNVLSHLLARLRGGSLHIVLDGSAHETRFTFVSQDAFSCRDSIPDEEASRRLALSRQLTEAIGGRLCVEESSIRLQFPRRSMALLVVDDNQDFIRLIERFLADSPYQVVSAQNAEQALALARQVKPFLITLDVMMPTHDGWEILQNLKHNPETSQIPIVICSILNEPELASSLGADDYLKKPITQKELLAVLARWEKPMP